MGKFYSKIGTGRALWLVLCIAMSGYFAYAMASTQKGFVAIIGFCICFMFLLALSYGASAD
jgi:hypothetical protein